MSMELAPLAVSLTTTLAPYLKPLLEKATEKTTEIMATGISEKAKQLWGKLKGIFIEEEEVKSAATLVSTMPEREDFQKILAELLAPHLEKNPALIAELKDILGGNAAINEIVAEKEAIVEQVRQSIKGAGRNTIKAGDKSRISGITQEINN